MKIFLGVLVASAFLLGCLAKSDEITNLGKLNRIILVNEKTWQSAENEFKTEYAHKVLEINGHGYAVALEALQMYGHLISKLKVDYRDLDKDHSRKLNEYITKFTGDNLISIQLVHVEDEKLVFLGPLKTVEYVKFSYGYLNSHFIKFSEIFPVVRVFDVSEMHYVHAGNFEENFPKLEHWIFEYWLGKYDTHMPMIEKRLEQNPHLVRITFYSSSWNVLKMVSNKLPYLEVLDLEHFHDYSIIDEDIHFENLKVFKFKVTSHMRPQIEKIPLVFGKLEKIEVHEPANEWLDIILQNKHLKAVEIGKIDDQQLFKIAQELTELEYFVSGFKTGFNVVEKVVGFIKEAKHLKKVSFWDSDANARTEIVKQLGSGWKIDDAKDIVRVEQ